MQPQTCAEWRPRSRRTSPFWRPISTFRHHGTPVCDSTSACWSKQGWALGGYAWQRCSPAVRSTCCTPRLTLPMTSYSVDSRQVIRPILVVGNPVLRQKAKRVSQVDRPIQKLIDDMIETMKKAPGVGLAAPQVGVPLRLAVIDVDDKITVIVNPEIVKTSGEVELDEGCLSVPGFWGRLNRAERVSVKALDRHGKDLRIRDAEGLFAQALQHEIV